MMMRGLAGYVMHSRTRAIIVVLLCGFIPMVYCLSAAAVGLVNLRKDAREGFMILLWSMVPAGFYWVVGDPSPIMLMPGVALLAHVLKHSESWSKVVMAGTIVALLVQLSLAWHDTYVTQLSSIVEEAMEIQRSQGAVMPYTAEQIVTLLLSFYGAYHFVTMLGCLVLARWWQAALYNPGGFREEFQMLRLEPGYAILLTGLMIAGLADLEPMDTWVSFLSIPSMLAGIALMHYVIQLKKLGSSWLFIGYLAVFFFMPALALLGLIDSVVNVRKRIASE
jgi:hypothetical protein